MLRLNNKITLIFIMSALALTASAAYINIGIQYYPLSTDSNQYYFLSLEKNLYMLDLSLNFFQNKLSLNVSSPEIMMMSSINLGYEIKKEDLKTLYKGKVFFGLKQNLKLGLIKISLQEETDQDSNFRVNGVIGFEF